MIPKILLQKAEELEQKTAKKYPDLAPLAKQCFLNTIETTVTQLADGSYFVITGTFPPCGSVTAPPSSSPISVCRPG